MREDDRLPRFNRAMQGGRVRGPLEGARMSDALLKFMCDAISYSINRERIEEERRTFVARFNERMARDRDERIRRLDRWPRGLGR